jgi:hypothetical protein
VPSNQRIIRSQTLAFAWNGKAAMDENYLSQLFVTQHHHSFGTITKILIYKK